MAITTFSLPADIPWQRIAFTPDMMDEVACDRALPLRWRSSIAVFAYEPPKEQQRTDGFIVSYLKVACTITGYQVGSEIQIRDRVSRSKWKDVDLTDRLGETADAYYACHGAMLEVVVAPHEDDQRFTFTEYPYFADFDPKKRELYEVVSETGETMSRSLENVGVRHGQTTLQSHEVRDKTTLGAGLAASYMGVTASGSVTNESGTTDLSQQGSENIRTTDASREARETFTHTTQLSQLYHQLDSYHLGTNRAAFFILPRPHTLQSPATFVNGPRQIEGIQEFMLAVVRPKEMETFCVEAYLETAHLTGRPRLEWGRTDTQLYLNIPTPDQTRRTGTSTSPLVNGYVVDLDTVPPGSIGGPPLHGDTGGYKVTSVTEGTSPRPEPSGGSDYTFIVGKEQVTVNGWVEGWFDRKRDIPLSSVLELHATVYLKKRVPVIAGYEPGLMITGRAVCSCDKRRLVTTAILDAPSIVFEKSLDGFATEWNPEREAMAIGDANKLGAKIKRVMLQSLSSANRYPRGTVGILDTQLVADMLGAHIRHATSDVNTPLSDWAGINQRLAHRVTAYEPSITRAQILEMPLADQVGRFGLTFPEAVELRRSLTDLADHKGPPPVPERIQVAVPRLTGLPSHEARAALAAARLTMGVITTVDSPLPSQTVIEHTPDVGAKVHVHSEVSIRVASGLSVRLPEVLGLPLSEASCRLRDSGVRSEPRVEGQPGPGGFVAGLEPPPGSLITPNAPVKITLKQRPAPRDGEK